MPADPSKQAKQDALRQHATLNPRPAGVTHALFATSEFFDPRDLLQAKYEMLRLVSVDKRPISEAAKACGFSRPSFYQAQAAFEQHGLAGLIARKPGPHGGHKLTPAVTQFLTEARTVNPDVRADHLAASVRKRFCVQVHPRSIERLLRKKNRAEFVVRFTGACTAQRWLDCPLRRTATPGARALWPSGARPGVAYASRRQCLDAGMEPVRGATAFSAAGAG